MIRCGYGVVILTSLLYLLEDIVNISEAETSPQLVYCERGILRQRGNWDVMCADGWLWEIGSRWSGG